MNKKTASVLELDKILSFLKEHAVMQETKDIIALMEPMTQIEAIEKALCETDEARIMSVKHGRAPLVPMQNIDASVKRALIGSALSCAELLSCAHVLRVSRLTIKYFDIKGFEADFPLLNLEASSLTPNKALEQRIFDCVISEDELDDNASAQLSRIRRKKQSLTNKVKDILNDIIKSPAYSQALREPIISVRGDRYVVPVKSEQKSALPGVVHDTSQTGGTLFVEPIKVVETNNAIRQLAAEEKEEINRILAELSAEVSGAAEQIKENFKTLRSIDFIFAKAAYADKIYAAKPVMNCENIIDIKMGRHPLIKPDTVVPVNIRVGEDFDTLVITGPNTGGKTVSLKTLGLFTLMAQCGLHVPCREGTRLAVFEKVFADIGDEQSIEQSLSTFSSHMVNIIGILEHCDSNSLVLFDELGAGTDPTEGAALATAILKNVRARGAVTAATTHYSEIKMFALSTPGVENAACEFDVNSLRPTYKLTVGALGKSCAFDIAKRLGMRQEVINEAAAMIDAENTRFEDIVTTLEKNRIQAQKEREAAELERSEAKRLKQRLEDEDTLLKEKQDKLLDDARRQAKKTLDGAKAEIDEKIKEMERAAQLKNHSDRKNAMEKARRDIAESISGIEESIGGSAFKARKKVNPGQLLPGTTVFLPSMNSTGSVLSAPDKNGNTEVMVGILKVKANVDSLELVADKKPAAERKTSAAVSPRSAQGIKSEIDLRGMSLDEAVAAVDKYIDDALLAHLNTVTIIHGRGTGVLKSGINQYLKGNRSVASFRLGKYGEGGDGVTIAELV